MLNVIYRVVQRGAARFVVEARSDDHGTWRHIDQFPTLEEANTRKARLEQILRKLQGEQG